MTNIYLRGVREPTSNTVEALVSSEPGTANHPTDIALISPFHVKPERALDGFRWAKAVSRETTRRRANHFGRRPDCRWLDFWRVVSRFHVLPARLLVPHGVPRETKCIVLFSTKAADMPPFDPHLLRGVREPTSNSVEPLASSGTGTANHKCFLFCTWIRRNERSSTS